MSVYVFEMPIFREDYSMKIEEIKELRIKPMLGWLDGGMTNTALRLWLLTLW